jgi:hypothetical protein
MIITRLAGGMGNQMFQYACGRALSLRYGVSLGLDTTFLLDRTPIPNFTFREYNLEPFNIQAQVVSKREVPFWHRKHFSGFFMRYGDALRRKLFTSPGKEKSDHHFDPAIFSVGPNAYLEGWWQSYRYFEGYEDIIRADFTLKTPPSEKVQALIDDIRSKNAVCLHIRRGDYLAASHFHPVLSKEYYDRALATIAETEAIDCIYVFERDDIEWCKEHLSFEYPVVYVENDCTMAEYVTVMSSCKHFVLANSSLSWWAGWLGTDSRKKVVCPSIWFADSSIDTKDRFPPEWITL